MFNINHIVEPNNKEELLEILSSIDKPTIIAGGTDILVALRHRKIKEVNLISIRNIDSFKNITFTELGDIKIGAMTSFSDILHSDIINSNLSILSEAAVSVGGPQIRNMATIGGNVCNGAVSADSVPALFALNALLKIESLSGEKLISIKDFYKGPGKVDLSTNEVLTEIIIKKEDYLNKKGNYIKFSNRKAMDISMLGVAAVAEFKNNTVVDLRIALGVAGPIPIRCSEAEAYAKGKELSFDTLNKIGELSVKASNARDSWRCSKAFREHLIYNLCKRAIEKTVK